MTRYSSWARGIFVFWILTELLFCLPSSVQSQEGYSPARQAELERRVRELEETVQELRAALLKKAPSDLPAGRIDTGGGPSTDPPLPSTPVLEPGISVADDADAKTTDKAATPVAGWKNGFFLQSTDKAYQLRITGQIQADYRAYLTEGDRIDLDQFLVRRARLGIEATVFDYFEFRLLPDFGLGRAAIQDSYINVHYIDAFQVQAGKFKEPVSYEQLIQDRFVPTLERSLIDQVVPARDVGVMLHGQKLLNDKFDWAVGVFNGQINGDADTNNRKDVAYRVAFRPFNWGTVLPALRHWQFGISGSTGIEQEPISPNVLRTPLQVPWFQFTNGVVANGLRNRWTPEISYFYGPLGFAAQYFRLNQEIAPAAGKAPQEVSMDGGYILATLLLTGEERTTYSQAIVPLRPFNPCSPFANPGAWELVTRVSRLELGPEVFLPGAARLADPAKFSSGATELTLGFNWYLNAWVRTQFNWEHAWFDEPVTLGPGPAGRLKDMNTIAVRLQVIF